MAKRKIKEGVHHFANLRQQSEAKDDNATPDNAEASAENPPAASAGKTPSYRDTVSAFFGDYQRPLNQGAIQVQYLPIADILPDPAQPRRIIPSLIRSLWDGQTAGMGELFLIWHNAACDERGADIDLDAYLQRDADDQHHLPAKGENVPDFGPLERSWRDLLNLAASIRHEGLTHPIAVARTAPTETRYIIESGERRWLAYQLLHWYFGLEENVNESGDHYDWSKMPARVMDERDIWRQAQENNARNDLNAIGRARQLALLIMDLYGMTRFQALQSFEHERDFYAQVADGHSWPIAKQHQERVLQAIGLSHPVQLRQYRALLKLTVDEWVYADDNNLPEKAIRNGAARPKTVSEDRPDALDRLIQRTLPKLKRDYRSLNAGQKRAMLQALQDFIQQLERE